MHPVRSISDNIYYPEEKNMKKMIAIALALLLVLSFAACAGGNKAPEAETTAADELVAGGWTTPEKLADAKLAEETVDMFSKACEKAEKNLTPAAILGTQVVAGTNYAFLCTEENKPVVAILYKGLEGDAELLSVKPIDVGAITESETEAGEEELAGGWTVGEEVTANDIGEDAQKALDAALKGFAGMSYEPVAVLGTQVVAGVNYVILCKGHAVVPGAASGLYLVKVFAGLDGSAEITATAAFNVADYTA